VNSTLLTGWKACGLAYLERHYLYSPSV